MEKRTGKERLELLIRLMTRLRRCRKCPLMHAPSVLGSPVLSPVLLVGQAPGSREGEFGKPFAWTAGKTLFRWFATIGVDEELFRSRVYMAAVCRCFPGKEHGHDRVPNSEEIERCSQWLKEEAALLHPELIIPVGKLAIGRFLEFDRLEQVIGEKFRLSESGHSFDVIALPHPSGASTWHRREPGKSLLHKALKMIGLHPAFEKVRMKRRPVLD